jgi:hypothetical protein
MPKWQYFFIKATNSQRKFGLDRNENPNYGREAVYFFLKTKKKKDMILAARLEGLFCAGTKVGCSFFLSPLDLAFEASHYGRPSQEAVGVHDQRFELWAWYVEVSHYARLEAPIPIFYWLFSTHFFGLSTKFGHSIPWPHDLDGRSVKRA